LSFTLRGFVEINTQIAALIGLSGATTLLGTAASPTPSTATAQVSPDLRDIVTDWNSHGDLSRYQYLLLSIVGAIVMVGAFWRNLEMPAIPSQVLYLLAGSQGTYVATKAIKASKTTDADAGGGGGGAAAVSTAVPAPSTMTPAPAGTATEAGSFPLDDK
jgi:hypothetical protein